MNLPTGPEHDFDQAKLLLQEYSFDLSGFQAGELVAIWQERLGAEPSWIRAAVLEALYQGRYKAFSVEQILQAWKRRGHPVRHFNSEFERVVFGPIDPTISKYAAMTTLSPSELMSPQSEGRSPSASPEAPESSPPIGRQVMLPFAKPAKASEPVPPASTVPPAEPVSPAEPVPPASTVTPEPAPEGNPTPEIDGPPPEAAIAPTAMPMAPPEPESDSPSAIATPYDIDSTQYSAVFNQPEPIRKFVPESEASEFYHRLQSVAKQSQ